VSDSRKKPIKSWDDVRHAFGDILKRPVNGFGWHKEIVGRYISGGMSIHLHVVYIANRTKRGICVECVRRLFVNDGNCNGADSTTEDNGQAVLV
jgi:hypothetical protein